MNFNDDDQNSINDGNLSEYERFPLFLTCKRQMCGILNDNSIHMLNVDRKSKGTKNEIIKDDNQNSINNGNLSE